MSRSYLPAVLAACALLSGAAHAAPGEPPVVSALEAEIARTMQVRLPDMPAPHHVTITRIGEDEIAIEATLGALVAQDRERAALLKVEVRVGDATFDSANFVGDGDGPLVAAETPLDGAADGTRHAAWLLADRSFKNATATYEAKRAHVESRAGQREVPADFSAAPAERSFTAQSAPLPDQASFVEIARRVSAVFADHPHVQTSSVRIVVRTRHRLLVDNEGTAVQEPWDFARVEIEGRTQAADGMILADYAAFTAPHHDGLPPIDVLLGAAKGVAQRLERLREAPVVDDYAGPVLLEDEAAPHALRVLLADELSATPPPGPDLDGASSRKSALSARVGWRVLPLDFSVIDDPTTDRAGELPLIGGYRFDDEGVRAQRVVVVDRGRLQSLLSSRTPSASMPASNGHGRAGVTGDARGRASNLIVSSRSGLTPAVLRARLIAAARREGLAYGIVVRRFDEPTVTGHVLDMASMGGTSGAILPAPTTMLRVYLDGREELVRGGTVVALRTRDLRNIAAAGREPFAYGYFASASPVRSSGNFNGEIPTTIVSPSLLLPDVDVRKPDRPPPRAPYVPAPTAAGK